MKRIAFDKRFVNSKGDDLIPGKIHTIRKNYPYWKKYEGQEVALFIWEGKPYRSKQKVFCIKKIFNVQMVEYECRQFWLTCCRLNNVIDQRAIAKNDGFNQMADYFDWFKNYKPQKEMAIIHFTDFLYRRVKC